MISLYQHFCCQGKWGVFTFDYLKEGSIFCCIPTGFSEQSAGGALQKKPNIFCWISHLHFHPCWSSVLHDVQQRAPNSSQHHPRTCGAIRPRWADRENQQTVLSFCYHLLLLWKHFEVLQSDRQLCAHGARAGTLTCTRTCCLYVLFWENPFSRCKTPENIDPNIRYRFFS